MHWTQRSVPVDEAAAAVIAAGMKAVARADGDVHPRELALIQAFEADLPVEGVPDARTTLRGEGLPETYARSLVMVALADGVISDEERRVIEELTQAVGLAPEALDTVILEVKQWFLQRFRGVTVFREAVEAIAEDLGIEADVADD